MNKINSWVYAEAVTLKWSAEQNIQRLDPEILSIISSNGISNVDIDSNEFKQRKFKFFQRLCLHLKPYLELHKNPWGQFDYYKQADWTLKRSWRPAVKHSIVVAERSLVLARLLWLEENLVWRIQIAWSVHDFNKLIERNIVLANTEQMWSWWYAYKNAEDQSSEILKKYINDPLIIKLVHWIGQFSFAEQERIMAQAPESVTAEEILFIIINYIDDISDSDNWCDYDAVTIRARNNWKKLAYQKANEEWRQHLNWRTIYEMQEIMWNKKQEFLSGFIRRRTWIDIDPKSLPLIIDAIIKWKIMNTAVVSEGN